MNDTLITNKELLMNDYIKSILKELVEIPSVSRDVPEIDWVYDVVTRELEGLPVSIKREECNNQPSLIITTQKTKSPKVWLYSHVDVVPAPDKVFQFTEDSEYFYGRGTLDMKFALAIYLAVFKELGQKLSEYDLGIFLVPDEEVGGSEGAKHVLDQGYGGGVVLIPDGAYNWHLEEKAKGIMILEAGATGSSAHGSRPWEGECAIEPLMEFAQRLKKIFPPLDPESGYDHSTVTISKFQGGKAMNMICPNAKVTFDIRIAPDDSKDNILKKIEEIHSDFPQITTKVLASGSHRHDSLDTPQIASFMESAKEHGIELTPALSHGSSDARYFYQHNIPAIISCPIGNGHHTDHERIQKKGLFTYYDIVRSWIEKEAR